MTLKELLARARADSPEAAVDIGDPLALALLQSCFSLLGERIERSAENVDVPGLGSFTALPEGDANRAAAVQTERQFVPLARRERLP